MVEIRCYTVTPYKGPRDIHRKPKAHAVMADSAANAAEHVTGEKLTPFGRVGDLRAQVSFAGLNGQTKTVLLYRQP